MDRLITAILDRFVSDFGVANLNKNSLRTSLLNGDVTLKDVVLDGHYFNSLQLPFEIVKGVVHRVEAKFSLVRLFSMPITAHVKGIYLLLRMPEGESWNEESCKLAKSRILDMLKFLGFGKKVRTKAGKAPPKAFLVRFLNNLQANVHDIHIRFIDSLPNEVPYAVGIRVESIHLHKAEFQPKSKFEVLKKWTLQGMSIYIDSYTPGQQEQVFDTFGLVRSIPHHDELVANMKMEAEKGPNARVHSYVLEPTVFDGRLRLNLNFFNDTSFPLVTITAKMNRIALSVEAQQYQRCLDFLTHIFSVLTWENICRLRPPQRPTHTGMARKWWRFAISRVIDKQHDEAVESGAQVRASIDPVVFVRSKRDEYIRLYVALCEGKEDVDSKAIARFEELERELPVSELLFFRQLAAHQLNKHAAALEEDALDLTEAERRKLYESFGMEQDLAEEELAPEDSAGAQPAKSPVLVEMDFRSQRVQAALGELGNDGTINHFVEVVLDDACVNVGLKTTPGRFDLRGHLGKFSVQDLHLHSQVVTSRALPGDADEPFIALAVSLNPPLRWDVEAVVLPLEAYPSTNFLRLLISFIRDPLTREQLSVFSGLAAVVSTNRRKLSPLQALFRVLEMDFAASVQFGGAKVMLVEPRERREEFVLSTVVPALVVEASHAAPILTFQVPLEEPVKVSSASSMATIRRSVQGLIGMLVNTLGVDTRGRGGGGDDGDGAGAGVVIDGLPSDLYQMAVNARDVSESLEEHLALLKKGFCVHKLGNHSKKKAERYIWLDAGETALVWSKDRHNHKKSPDKQLDLGTVAKVVYGQEGSVFAEYLASHPAVAELKQLSLSLVATERSVHLICHTIQEFKALDSVLDYVLRKKGRPHAWRCVLVDPPPDQAFAGETIPVVVQCHDVLGARCTSGGEDFLVCWVPSAGQGQKHVTGMIDNDDGTYTGFITPSGVGEFSLSVVHHEGPNRDLAVQRRNWTVAVRPGLVGPQTTVEGPGVVGPVYLHAPAQFVIRARDEFGNPIDESPILSLPASAAGVEHRLVRRFKPDDTPFDVKVRVVERTDRADDDHAAAARAAPASELPCTVKNNGDGSFAVEYVPEGGAKTVTVAVAISAHVGGLAHPRPIKGSPFTVAVRSSRKPRDLSAMLMARRGSAMNSMEDVLEPESNPRKSSGLDPARLLEFLKQRSHDEPHGRKDSVNAAAEARVLELSLKVQKLEGLLETLASMNSILKDENHGLKSMLESEMQVAQMLRRENEQLLRRGDEPDDDASSQWSLSLSQSDRE